MDADFIKQMPKVELHLHIEGTMEPDMFIELAKRNNVLDDMQHRTVESLTRAYQFTDLQSFLDLYYQGSNVLLVERDFYDLTMAYLKRAHYENIRHVEIFFDPQAHTARGVPFDTVSQWHSFRLGVSTRCVWYKPSAHNVHIARSVGRRWYGGAGAGATSQG